MARDAKDEREINECTRIKNTGNQGVGEREKKKRGKERGVKNTIDLNMPWYDGKKKMEIRDDRKK